MQGEIRIFPDRIWAVGIETGSGNEVYEAKVVDGKEEWTGPVPAVVKAELRKAASRLSAVAHATRKPKAKAKPKKAPAG